MKVSANVQNHGSVLTGGGLMSLMTQDAKDSFSSMLGAADMAHAPPDDRGPVEQRGGGEDSRPSGKDRGDHMRKTKSSQHRESSSTNARLEAAATTGESRRLVYSPVQSVNETSVEDSGSDSAANGRQDSTATILFGDGLSAEGSNDLANDIGPSGFKDGDKPASSHAVVEAAPTSGQSRIASHVQASSQIGGTPAKQSGFVDGSFAAAVHGGDVSNVSSEGAIAGSDNQQLPIAEMNLQQGQKNKLVPSAHLQPVFPQLSLAGPVTPKSVSGANSGSTDPQITQNNQSQGGSANQQGSRGDQTHHAAPNGSARDAQIIIGPAQGPAAATAPTAALGTTTVGQRTPVASNAGESARPAGANSSSKDSGIPNVADASTIRMLATATHRELQVGVHTEAFGRVTIQTSSAVGQLSAQVSLEDPKQAAVLAAHLPIAEQRIMQQHGLDVSVRMSAAMHTGFGNTGTGSGQRGADADRRQGRERLSDTRFDRGVSHIGSSGSGTGVRGEMHLSAGRLDVTA